MFGHGLGGRRDTKWLRVSHFWHSVNTYVNQLRQSHIRNDHVLDAEMTCMLASGVSDTLTAVFLLATFSLTYG